MTATKAWHGGELRWDHLDGEWTVLAPGRAARPQGAAAPCPFCPGPGEDTPPETWRLPGERPGSWQVRAVPNRYALSDHHEVIVESPDHDWNPATATTAEVGNVLLAWQARHRALRSHAAQVVLFRNHGAAAGTSLSHPHSQAVGLPVLSSATRRELTVMREHYDRNGRSFAAEILAGELSSGERIVLADGDTAAFVPFSPAAEFEVRISPTRNRADFAAVPHGELDGIARALRTVLAALHTELHEPAYNLVLHTAPVGLEHVPYLSWWLRILPRLTIPAGLELATGIPVSTVLPEEAAKRLRDRVQDPGSQEVPARQREDAG
ncbi:galactose-1-phosphate uridylyltransferase [Amycolatopsis sp. K13G38]|uniref:Galactose-1-phosphate uridylyltransferase n=1 Tax=Amycolatopsis acididurans TaxID=2724524 RepID=A0ABX1J2K1_9PSEU|nr:galactose-1-phosphate uridylyltransferase [Amycolatopsis acididurans]NKQ54006.1 galactose-1-phosphate uridylyltransferase [Amycolatopsis acididurans]